MIFDAKQVLLTIYRGLIQGPCVHYMISLKCSVRKKIRAVFLVGVELVLKLLTVYYIWQV
jgi:hypothetical protein